MKFNPPEIVKVLKQQQQHHREQLRLIDIALTAIESGGDFALSTPGANDPELEKHRIQWTREIDKILDNYREFTIMDLQSDLAETRDIPSAQSITGRNIINTALSHLEKKGRIKKSRPGVYKVVQASHPT